MDAQTEVATVEEAPTTSTPAAVDHDRQVTPTAGSVRIGRWEYPARVFDGVAQYQTREGEWKDTPLPGES